MTQFELQKFIEALKESRPYLFKPSARTAYSLTPYTRLIEKIQYFSKNVLFDLRVYILREANSKYVLDKYKIEKEIKESTFSNTYVVS